MGILSKLFGGSNTTSSTRGATKKKKEQDLKPVPAPEPGTDPTDYVIDVLCSLTPVNVKRKQISLEDDLAKDVGIDEFDIVETIIQIEDTYGVEFSEQETDDLLSIDDLRRGLAGKIGYTGEFRS